MSKRVVIVGGGRSINDGRAIGLWDKIKNEDVWSLNYAYKTLPFLPKKQLFVDVSFFNDNRQTIEDLANKGVQIVARRHQRYCAIPNIEQYLTTRVKGEYDDKRAIQNNRIYIGRMGLVGFFALSYAVAKGYTEIYLLGYDFGAVCDPVKTHYYEDEIQVISSGISRPEIYLRGDKVRPEVEDFEVYLRNTDIKIYNVSPKSNINCFEKIDYPTFFNKLGANNETKS